ncbi:puromycin-sensitive aminopeptidase-like protein [Coccinella septempunctata]|uniref:puromycin-sensitive aminopeptidase-like protein n=1 Tax=Coccinella septempunctata TaxID=41139 RepID=UPI001D05FD2B|nr:puromycin-sensitive aminopeptidase-like protein [Coccinella septempunctata]
MGIWIFQNIRLSNPICIDSRFVQGKQNSMRGILVVFLCFAFMASVLSKDIPKFRLENNAIPRSYDIRIKPNMKNNSFYGEVKIFVELQHLLQNISLNIKDIVVDSLVLDNSENQTKYFIHKKNEMLLVYYNDHSLIGPGEHLIHVKYKGTMRSDSIGLFKSVIDSQGKKFVSAATMFSAPYARMVFPCFDEPAYKARFNVRLVKPDETFTALSNMEKINSFEVKDGIAVDFQTTPEISPYIVCFVFTQYNFKSSEYTSMDGRVIPLRFFMLDEYLDQAPFLLEVAKHALGFFENYTNMTYPISKLDFIEVNQFIFEGMENIGLVILTHNSVSFNASSNISKVKHLRNAAQLIVHEISHMWFGDIVTPLWYNDLWLAEGFAELMEIKGLHNQYPLWQLEDMESVLRREGVFYSDNTPIINFPVNNGEVEEQFSDITYSKGSAVLRMLEMVMGENKFKMGVRKFLKDFYMSSATTGSFINVMQSFLPTTNLRGFLETWLDQDKFPLLTVSKDNGYVLRQRSFAIRSNSTSIFGKKWTIPVTFISSCNKSVSLNWFDRDADSLRIPSCGESWIKLNHKARGHYRVLYTEEQYDQLLNNFHDLVEVDQANLILETAQLVSEKLIPCEIPLKFIGKLRKKDGLLPSIASFRIIRGMMNALAVNRSVYDKIRKYFIDTFKDLYEKLQWRVDKMDTPVVRLLRSKLIENLCSPEIAYEKCLSDAEKVKKEHGELHQDVFFVWRNLIQKKNVVDEINPVKNSTTKNNIFLDNATQLFVEKCMTWVKSNL